MKIEKTEEQIRVEKELHEAKKKEARQFRSLATRVKNACHEVDGVGIRSIKAQLDFLKNNNTILPNKNLTKERNIEAFELGIAKFLDPTI